MSGALALAACASNNTDYPSLAIRDAERVEGTFEAASPAALPQPDPVAEGTLGQLAQLREAARNAHNAFTSAVPEARRLVAAARGAGTSSDRWAAAQVALADLDSSRSQATIALGDLDLLFVDATLDYTQRDEIAATRDEVAGLIARQDRILAELRNLIG